MTALLQRAFAVVAALPDIDQDEYARLLLRLLGKDEAVIELSAEEIADLEAAEGEADRGEFMTDGELESLWARFVA